MIARPYAQLPKGSTISGKLLTPLDTRHPERIVKAILPYGVEFDGETALPPRTVLFGRMSYGGSGKIIEINFNRGLMSSGKEFAFTGKSQVAGVHHGGGKWRVAKSLGPCGNFRYGGYFSSKGHF